MAARPEISLTKPLEPVLDWLAKEVGVDVSTLATITGGEAIGVGVEALTDAVLKGWLNKLVQALVGIGCIAGMFHEGTPARLRTELYEIGTHSLSRLVDPKPKDVEELIESINKACEAIKRGDWAEFLKSGIRSPEEWNRVKELIGRSSSGSTTAMITTPAVGEFEVEAKATPPKQERQEASAFVEEF